MLKGRKILLGITGSIAAYKAIYLVRSLVKSGAEVKVIITPSARDFVSPLTLSTLSHHPVLVDLFDEQSWSNHVMLGRWADIMLIAPLSCNTLAKMAGGLCDNLLMAVYLSATCPVLVAPAMDEDMWKHPATRANLEKIESYGNKIIPVGKGELASGLVGEGRMAEPEEIMGFLDRFFLPGPLKDKKVLVSAGPTYEHIDPVRFIGNHSSGKMGLAIAAELKRRGARVSLVLGPVQQKEIPSGMEVIDVVSAADMFTACNRVFEEADLAIMAAAVADYTPGITETEKIKKKEDTMTIGLIKTKDILRSLGEKKKKNQVLIGFALETNNEEQHAREKLVNKNADMIVLNSLNDPGAGFGKDTNKITIFDKDGSRYDFGTRSKKEVACDIIDTIIRHYYA